MATSVPAGGETTFTLVFAPQETANSDLRNVTVRITSNDPINGVYEIPMDGKAASSTLDSDTDGMTDAEEARLKSIGFDLYTTQPQMVNVFNSSRAEAQQNVLNDPNAHNLYTPVQIQTQHPGVTLIQRDTQNQFTLTLGLSKSGNLQQGSFTPMLMTAPATSINGDGKLEFDFSLGDDKGFFRVETP